MSLDIFLKRGVRRGSYIVGVGLLGAYAWMALRGPQGIETLLEKHREIRQLQERNATNARENERRRDHIRRLKDSQSEQDMEIRKQLKLVRPGETTFILPDGAKDTPPPEPEK
jgi:cell division protein FtsB